MANATYRPEIDGLRAVAIIPVVLFHAGVATLGGGFTGVDIFFVISGFLITGILFRELLSDGRIDILGFYARRVARLFPSLLLVVAVTLIAGTFLLSPALFEVHSLAKSAIASLGFVANFYFIADVGDYFAADTRGLPLLHMWSLAVEEQYYMAWPAILLLAGILSRRFGNLRTFCLGGIIAVTVTSMIYAAWLTPLDKIAAFYLPFSRVWELGIGSGVALIERRPTKMHSTLSGIGGIVLVIFSIIFVREGSGFPFPMAVLPVLGTALILWSGQGADPGPASKLLGFAALRSVGTVSYAWYLWHWPFLAFAHLLTLGQASLQFKLSLALVSLVISYVTVNIFESKIRFGIARRARPKSVVAVGAAASVLLISLAGGIYVLARNGVLLGDERIAAAFNDRPVKQQTCLLRDFAVDGHIPDACLVAGAQPAVLLWGDSQASQWAPAIDAWQRSHSEWRVEQITLAACPPLVGLTPTDPSGLQGKPYDACKRINDIAIDRLNLKRPLVVVLGGNWLPRSGIGGPGIRQYFEARRGTGANSLKYFEIGLDRTLGLLREKSIPVAIVLQSPVQGVIPAACVQRRGPTHCFISYPDFRREAEVVNAVILRVANRHPGTRIFDPTTVLCNKRTCNAEIDGKIAYFDGDHVAASTAESKRSMQQWAPLITPLTAGVAPHARGASRRLEF